MQDPIADLLTRLRNGCIAKQAVVRIPASKIKQSILEVLYNEGYISGYQVEQLENNKSEISVDLKYYKGSPVISKIKRISRPGLRVYKARNNIPNILGGLGISVISTTKGIVSDRQARQLGQGGEVLCCIE